jgi:hypothetical protein
MGDAREEELMARKRSLVAEAVALEEVKRLRGGGVGVLSTETK